MDKSEIEIIIIVVAIAGAFLAVSKPWRGWEGGRSPFSVENPQPEKAFGMSLGIGGGSSQAVISEVTFATGYFTINGNRLDANKTILINTNDITFKFKATNNVAYIGDVWVTVDGEKKMLSKAGSNTWKLEITLSDGTYEVLGYLNPKDSDGDGLSDYKEVKNYGTDRNDPDTDSDGLKDGWEVKGVSNNGTYVPLDEYGADPLHKDVFVEMDWINESNWLPGPDGVMKIWKDDYYQLKQDSHDSNDFQWWYTTFAETECPFTPSDLNRSPQEAFANVPTVKNPDGTTGVDLHVDAGQFGGGSQVPEAFVIEDDGYTTHIKDYRDKYLSDGRKGLFYYCLIVPRGPVWGQAYPWLGALVVQDGTDDPDWTPTDRNHDEAFVSAFMHELGHCLGLHGCFDGIDRQKYSRANYTSVMNLYLANDPFLFYSYEDIGGNPQKFNDWDCIIDGNLTPRGDKDWRG